MSSTRTILWLQAESCGGESASLLNVDQPDLLQALALLDARLIWFPYLPGPEDWAVEETLADLTAGRLGLDVLIVEGAISHRVSVAQPVRASGRTISELLPALASTARYTMTVGTCAAFGGVMARGRKQGGATGVQFLRDQPGGLLGSDFRSPAGLPVVNVPGCPAHPDWIVGTLFMLLEDALTVADLDRFNRCLVYYSRLAHHGCPRNEYYEFKASALECSQQGCLFENLGCKGTQCESDCNERLWLGRTGSCPRGGFSCLSCTSPLFPNGFSPFFETHKISGIPTSLPLDVPKAWYVGISGLSKAACPERLRTSAVSFTRVEPERGHAKDAGDTEDRRR